MFFFIKRYQFFTQILIGCHSFKNIPNILLKLRTLAATLVGQPLSDACCLCPVTEGSTERHIDVHIVRIEISIEGSQNTILAHTRAYPLAIEIT